MKKVFLIALVAFIYAGCGGGKDGASCTVVENTDGTYSIVCDDETSVTFSDGTDGTKALVKTSEEPPGDNCPNGGIKIESGIDDGDGNFIGDSEVTYVCDGESGQDGQDGQDGAKALVQTSEEPPGANCPNGGIKIEAGIDDGEGNFIGDPEVTYVCDGESGEDGISMLMITEELAEGDPDCPTGGIVVHTGVDTNGNGVLDEDEITSTNYLCNGEDGEDLLFAGILEGSYTIRNSMDVHFLSSITEITGDLIVDAPGMISLHLPNLESVGRVLGIQSNAALTNIDLPALTSVGWMLHIQNNAALTNIDLPALTSVGGHLTIYNNAALTTIDLPLLASVGWNLEIWSNAALTTIELPALDSVWGYLEIWYNAALTTIELPALDSGLYLMIWFNSALTTIELPALDSGSSLTISYNYALTTIDLPALASVGWHLEIQNNAALTTIDLPLLTSVGSNLSISYNYALTTIELPALTSVGSLVISYNDALTSIDLPALDSVWGQLLIRDNTALTTIDLPALTSLDEDLHIYSNTILCNSIAIAIRDQLIAAGWTGDWEIYDNDNDC